MPTSQPAAATYDSFLIGNYFSNSARVLFLWEYIITLGDEVRYIWAMKVTTATWLFVLNRYLGMIITIMELVQQAPLQSCGPFIRIVQAFVCASQVVVGLFAALRTYAVCGYDWRPASAVFVLMLASLALAIVLNVFQHPSVVPSPSTGCTFYFDISPSMYTKLWIACRATMTACEVVALKYTLAKTIWIRRLASEARVRPNLTQLLWEHGIWYFVAMASLNLAQIIELSRVSVQIRVDGTERSLQGNPFLASYVSPLTSILVSRFLLNLRRVAYAVDTQRDSQLSDDDQSEIRWVGSDLAGNVDMASCH